MRSPTAVRPERHWEMHCAPQGSDFVDCIRSGKCPHQLEQVARNYLRWSWAVLWASQDLNLGPHPYQAYSRDAFLLEERDRASSAVGWQ